MDRYSRPKQLASHGIRDDRLTSGVENAQTKITETREDRISYLGMKFWSSENFVWFQDDGSGRSGGHDPGVLDWLGGGQILPRKDIREEIPFLVDEMRRNDLHICLRYCSNAIPQRPDLPDHVAPGHQDQREAQHHQHHRAGQRDDSPRGEASPMARSGRTRRLGRGRISPEGDRGDDGIGILAELELLSIRLPVVLDLAGEEIGLDSIDRHIECLSCRPKAESSSHVDRQGQGDGAAKELTIFLSIRRGESNEGDEVFGVLVGVGTRTGNDRGGDEIGHAGL